jgi:N-acetylmuramic acid 6-phosphate etherase
MERSAQQVLGIDGGGTKTAWALLDVDEAETRIIAEGKLPPSNFRLIDRQQIAEIFRAMPQTPSRVGAFLAGCATDEDRRTLGALCREVWPGAAIVVGSDRDSGFAAAFRDGDGIVVNAGTGSSITGRRGGRVESAGGWGHILGDTGGGYFLAVQTLRLVLREYDLQRTTTRLAHSILRELGLNSLDELVRWAQAAGKIDLAMLAPIVFAAAEEGHNEVKEILRAGATVLAEYTAAVARRLDFSGPPVRLMGGLFCGHTVYAEIFRKALSQFLPESSVALSENGAELGAAWLATQSDEAVVNSVRSVSSRAAWEVELASAATEEENERSARLDQLTPLEFVELFVAEEKFVEDALRVSTAQLARGIEIVSDALRAGGKLFYIGAGTSGRLGVLDASEIPPTFGVSSELVQGIIAGGAGALVRSVEGAEDEREAGAVSLSQRGVTALDVVCGIAASGRTPFVLGALALAKTTGARTILLTCNPQPTAAAVDLRIDLPTGAELVTGSTRLKAGTATKIALNILSTGAMVQLGRVRGNVMVDLQITNAKLRERAARSLARLAGCDYAEALRRLAASGWNLRKALER